MNKLYRFLLFFSLCFFVFDSFSQKKELDRNDITYTYIEAIRHKVFGNLPQAAYLFKKIADSDSTCASCYFELSNIFYSGGDINNGLQYAQKAYSLDSSNYWYAKNYADYLRYNSQWANALNIYRNVVKFKETSLEDTFYLAECLLNVGHSKEGLSIINSIEREYGVSEKFILLKYRYYLNVKDYKIALEELNKLIHLNPENYLYYGMQAEIFALQKKVPDAFASYKKLIEAMPNYANAYISLGKFYLSLKDTANAYKQFNHILTESAFSKSNRIDLVNSFLKERDYRNYYSYFITNYFKPFISKNDTVAAYKEFLCDYYESRNDYENALKISSDLIQMLNPLPAYYDRYFYYLNVLKEYDVILKNEDLVKLRLSDRPFVLFITGLAAYIKEQPEKSIYYLKRGLDFGQGNKFLSNQMLNLIAENYYKIHKPDSSFYYYELALSEGDSDIGMLNNYAYYLSVENKDLDRALKMSKETIEKEPKNATYLDTYAWILFHLKLYDEAYKYIKLAYKYDNRGSFEMVEHVGDILFCKGKKKRAFKFWKKAAAMSNNDAILKKINTYVCP